MLQTTHNQLHKCEAVARKICWEWWGPTGGSFCNVASKTFICMQIFYVNYKPLQSVLLLTLD